MNMEELKSKWNLLKIKGLLKLDKFLHNKQLTSGKRNTGIASLEDIYKCLNADKIALQLHSKNKSDKQFIIQLAQLLTEYGKEIELIEFERIFENKEIREMEKSIPNVSIDFRYTLNSYYSGINVNQTYKISDYCRLLNKIEYLGQITTENFKNEDEQIMFIITQLAGYADYLAEADYADYSDISMENLNTMSKEEKEKYYKISNLFGCLENRNTVCMGYATTFRHILENLGYECNIVSGSSDENTNDLNHAWNQVKVNGNWYNADLTWFKSEKDDTKKLRWVLVDDEAFNKYHKIVENDETHKCNTILNTKRYIYEKIKPIKNVLEAYDNGKRDLILQYEIAEISRTRGKRK